MLDIMHFKKESYDRYFFRETQMVNDRIQQITSNNSEKTIVVFTMPHLNT